MQKTITIPEKHKEALTEHAEKYFPNESCALLFGRADDGGFIVEDVFLAENAEESQSNFTIANDDLIRGYGEAERRALDVVGIFHSHPHSEAVPSPTDRKYMETNPVVWVIFSNKFDDMKAYVMESDVIQVKIKTA